MGATGLDLMRDQYLFAARVGTMDFTAVRVSFLAGGPEAL
jgi:hypothetical protein